MSRKMKNSNIQHPTSREIPMNNHQTTYRARHSPRVARHSCWSLKFGASLMPGCWCLALLISVLGFQFSALSQGYSIDWHKIAGGGGTSTNGQFAVSGTIGQPDAGSTITNVQFSVTGGFWVLPQAVQTEGAPMLSISAAAPGNVIISWTPATPGYVLQESWSLSS